MKINLQPNTNLKFDLYAKINSKQTFNQKEEIGLCGFLVAKLLYKFVS